MVGCEDSLVELLYHSKAVGADVSACTSVRRGLHGKQVVCAYRGCSDVLRNSSFNGVSLTTCKRRRLTLVSRLYRSLLHVRQLFRSLKPSLLVLRQLSSYCGRRRMKG